ncbi:MAG TPA: hypothetical protein VFF06_28650 [Polyangia bacterium]|nr:hypothetical protein [Polyangia bacterium]
MSRHVYRSFEFAVVADGKTVIRTCLNGRPTVGEEIEIDGANYRVTRVRHGQDERRTADRVYVTPTVYARAVRRRRA